MVHLVIIQLNNFFTLIHLKIKSIVFKSYMIWCIHSFEFIVEFQGHTQSFLKENKTLLFPRFYGLLELISLYKALFSAMERLLIENHRLVSAHLWNDLNKIIQKLGAIDTIFHEVNFEKITNNEILNVIFDYWSYVIVFKVNLY